MAKITRRHVTRRYLIDCLAQAGFIKYSRGAMQILDREGLEEASGECYAPSVAQFATLMAA